MYLCDNRKVAVAVSVNVRPAAYSNQVKALRICPQGPDTKFETSKVVERG